MLLLIDVPQPAARAIRAKKGALYFPISHNGRYLGHFRARIVNEPIAARLRPYLSNELPTLGEGEIINWNGIEGVVLDDFPEDGTVRVQTNKGERIISKALIDA